MSSQSKGQSQAKLVFLWTCPRSCSTAFERSINTLSTTKLLDEPFQKPYYYGPQRQSPRYTSQTIHPSKNVDYEDTVKSILAQANDEITEVLFIKDFGYQVRGRLSLVKEYFYDAKHSFLIRHPKKAIRSAYRVTKNPEVLDWDYFDPSESGFKELFELYEFVQEKLDPNPLVIDADDLLNSPKEMMKAYCEGVGIQYEDHMTSWKAGEVLKIWENGQGLGWMHRAIHSNGFIKPRDSTSSDPDVTYPADVIKSIEESLPFYEKLYSARVRLIE